MKRLTVEVDQRMYDHLEALRKAASITSGYHVSMAQMVRKALTSRFCYGDVYIQVKNNEPLVAQLIKEGV